MSFCLFAGMVLNGQTSPAMKVAASGNVGIGTANPIASLHVKGSGAAFEPSDGQAQPVINFQGTDNTARFQFQNFTNTTTSNSYFLMFGQDVNAPARTGELTFAGNYQRFFYGVSDAGATAFGTEGMRLTSEGKLGVGTSSVPATHIANFNGTILVNGTTVGSDRKLKSNVRSFDYGLNEIMRMSPKFYNYNGSILKDDGIKAGIIAQEFQKIIPEAVVTVDYQKHNMDNEVIEEGDYLAVNTDMIRYTLVNAIQEQQGQIEALKSDNEDLRAMLNEVLESIAATNSNIDAKLDGSKKVALLEQNAPNPFSGQTELNYFIPEGTGKAQMTFTSNTGQVLKTINITEKGNGKISLTSEDLPSGIYRYSLTIDGKVIDTKSMSLVK